MTALAIPRQLAGNGGRRAWRLTLAALGLTALSAAAASQPVADADWRIEQQSWVGEIAPGTPIEIENLHGDLHLRPMKSAELQLSGTFQRHVADPADQALVHEQRDGRFYVRTEPGTTAEGRKGPARRVDLSVLVPANSPLVLRTRAGGIHGRRLVNAVTAESGAGAIDITTRRTLSARTGGGSILGRVGCLDWSAPMSLQTSTGDIALRLARGCAGSVHVRTKGEFTTDYSATVRRDGTTRIAQATLGPGAARIDIQSDIGAVKLLQSDR